MKIDTRSHKKRFVLLLILLIGTVIVSANMGATQLRWQSLTSLDFNDPHWQIWLHIRLPRILLALLVGFALALAGTLFQGLFKNPMADPALIGVNSGAALAVAISILLPSLIPVGFTLYSSIIAAFIGSLMITFIIYLFSYYQNASISKLLLIGIAINALCGAFIGILTYLSDDQQLRQFSLWVMGTLGQAQWQTIIIASLLILPTALFALKLSSALNLLQLGEEEAHYLGVHTRQLKQQLILLAALLVGVSVSVSGVIGFLSLVIPHLARFQFGADHRWVLPVSAINGAMLLLIADTLARTIISPAELPVGILTSFIGAPYFLWLILTSKGTH